MGSHPKRELRDHTTWKMQPEDLGQWTKASLVEMRVHMTRLAAEAMATSRPVRSTTCVRRLTAADRRSFLGQHGGRRHLLHV